MKVAIFTDTMDRRAMGTALYTKKLVEGLVELQAQKNFELFLVHREKTNNVLYQRAHEILLPKVFLPKFSRFFSETFFLWRTRNDFDVIHYPQECNYPLFFITNAKIVLTVHSHIEGWKNFGLYQRYLLVYWTLKFFKNKIQKIIAVSHSTKKNIIQHFSIPEEKITVIYEGVDPSFFQEKTKEEAQKNIEEKYGIRAPYILNGSRIDPHKNVLRVIKAFYVLKQKGIPHNLVIGEKHWPSENQKVEGLIKKYGLENSVYHKPYIEEEDMPDLYRAADCFVFPSLHEGFGLPIIESMAVGTPVITSNIFSMPEIAGGNAMLVDPYSISEIAGTVEKAIKKSADIIALCEKGKWWAKTFDWKKMSRETYLLYQSF